MNGLKHRLLIITSVFEVATGLALLIVPALVGEALLGEKIDGITLLVGRVAGLALIGLGIACWPGPALAGMLTYSAGITLYLAYLGLGGIAGPLLWPAVVVHAVLTVLLALSLLRPRSDPT